MVKVDLRQSKYVKLQASVCVCVFGMCIIEFQLWESRTISCDEISGTKAQSLVSFMDTPMKTRCRFTTTNKIPAGPWGVWQICLEILEISYQISASSAPKVLLWLVRVLPRMPNSTWDTVSTPLMATMTTPPMLVNRVLANLVLATSCCCYLRICM